MEIVEIKFKCYAEHKESAIDAQMALQNFVEDLRQNGAVLTAEKIAQYTPTWKNSGIVRNVIINKLSNE